MSPDRLLPDARDKVEAVLDHWYPSKIDRARIKACAGDILAALAVVGADLTPNLGETSSKLVCPNCGVGADPPHDAAQILRDFAAVDDDDVVMARFSEACPWCRIGGGAGIPWEHEGACPISRAREFVAARVSSTQTAEEK